MLVAVLMDGRSLRPLSVLDLRLRGPLECHVAGAPGERWALYGSATQEILNRDQTHGRKIFRFWQLRSDRPQEGYQATFLALPEQLRHFDTIEKEATPAVSHRQEARPGGQT